LAKCWTCTLHVEREHGKALLVELVGQSPVPTGVLAKPMEDEHRGPARAESTVRQHHRLVQNSRKRRKQKGSEIARRFFNSLLIKN
jgi:hypothetical protein